MEAIQKLVEEAKRSGLADTEAWASAIKTITQQQERDERKQEREHKEFMAKQEAQKRAHEKEMEETRIKEEEAKRKWQENENEKQRKHELDIQKERSQAERNKTEGQLQVIEARNENKEVVPKYKKYQGIVKFYTPEMDISSWIRNLESIMIDDNIPRGDWAYILRKCLSCEPLKLLETVPYNELQSYEYLKQRILQHYSMTRASLRSAFRDLKPKADHTFVDYASEVTLMLEKYLDISDVRNNFKSLKELVIADKIISSVPSKLSTFLIEQRAETLQQIYEIGTAYYEANRDIFAAGTTTQLTIAAAAMNNNTSRSESKLFKAKPNWRGRHGVAIECPHCQTRHGQMEMCDENPNINKYMDKHRKYMQTKTQRYWDRKKCYCCRSIGHVQAQCGCKRYTYTANVGEEYDSDTSGTTDSETMHAYAAAQNTIAEKNKCQTCSKFNETCGLPCGHVVPGIVKSANAADTGGESLKTYRGVVNGQQVKVLKDTGTNLIGIKQSLVREEDYTNEHIICRTFAGTKELLRIAWANIQTPFYSGRIKGAVLFDPFCELILGVVPEMQECDDETIQKWEQNCLGNDANTFSTNKCGNGSKDEEEKLDQSNIIKRTNAEADDNAKAVNSSQKSFSKTLQLMVPELNRYNYKRHQQWQQVNISQHTDNQHSIDKMWAWKKSKANTSGGTILDNACTIVQGKTQPPDTPTVKWEVQTSTAIINGNSRTLSKKQKTTLLKTRDKSCKQNKSSKPWGYCLSMLLIITACIDIYVEVTHTMMTIRINKEQGKPTHSNQVNNRVHLFNNYSNRHKTKQTDQQSIYSFGQRKVKHSRNTSQISKGKATHKHTKKNICKIKWKQNGKNTM